MPAAISEIHSPLRTQARPAGRDTLLCVALACLTLIVYLQTGRFEFVPIDDPLYITGNPRMHDGLTWDNVRWACTATAVYNWAPLTWLSYFLDASLYGDWAGGFHLTNVVLHVVNVLLLFVCLRRATDHSLRAAFVAGLFAVHPLHVESVAWISERKDVLSLLFGFLSIYAYLRYAEAGRNRWYVAALASFALSLTAKATLVTFPCVLMLLDCWPLSRWTRPLEPGESGRRRALGLIAEKLPFAALSAAICWITTHAQAAGGAVQALESFPLHVRAANAVLAYGQYLRDAIWPVGLAVFYPHRGEQIDMRAVALSGVVLAAISLFALANFRRRPFLIVCWLWYLGTLVPMIGLVQVGTQQRADRYTYFPLIGIYIAVAWFVSPLIRRLTSERGVSATLGTAVIGALAALAFVQVGAWKDGLTLFGRALARTDDNTFSRGLYGDSLLALGRFDEAVEQYRRTIELTPNDPGQYVRLGEVYEGHKRFDEAIALYHAALAVDPECITAHNRLGMIHVARRQYSGAFQEFQVALEINPQSGLAYAGLSALCRAQGHLSQSIELGERALELDARLIDCHRVIALDLRDQGRIEEAIDRLEIVVDEAPHNEQAREELASLLEMTGRSLDDGSL